MDLWELFSLLKHHWPHSLFDGSQADVFADEIKLYLRYICQLLSSLSDSSLCVTIRSESDNPVNRLQTPVESIYLLVLAANFFFATLTWLSR